MAMQPGGKKSGFSTGRPKPATPERVSSPAPQPAEAPPPSPPRSLADRLPDMSDAQLLALQDNALRVSQADQDRKQAQAMELLPLIATEIEVRKSAKADAAAVRRKDAAAKRASTRAVARVKKSPGDGATVSKEDVAG